MLMSLIAVPVDSKKLNDVVKKKVVEKDQISWR